MGLLGITELTEFFESGKSPGTIAEVVGARFKDGK